jgi:hypothetical protein
MAPPRRRPAPRLLLLLAAALSASATTTTTAAAYGNSDDHVALKHLPARPSDGAQARQRYHFPLLAPAGLEAVNAYLDEGDVSPLLGPACGASNPRRPADGMCADYLSAFSGLAVLPHADAFARALSGAAAEAGAEDEEDVAGTGLAGGAFAATTGATPPGGGGGGADSSSSSSSSSSSPVLLLGVTDRGPAVRCGWLPGGSARVPRRLRESVAFAAPKFSPSLTLTRLNRQTGRAELVGACFLRAPASSASGGRAAARAGDGMVPVTGLPNLPGHSEEPAAWDGGEDGGAGAPTCAGLDGGGEAGGRGAALAARSFPPASPFYFPPGYNMRGMDTADVKPLGWTWEAAAAEEVAEGAGGGGGNDSGRLCLVAEQDAPSLALVSCDFADPRACGAVLRRWVPKQVPGNLQYPQTDKALPASPLLPRLFGLRRAGHGLRALAVSPSGRRAIALLGGSIGTGPEGFGDAGASHLVYAVELDLSAVGGGGAAGAGQGGAGGAALAGVYAYAADWADVDGAVPRAWTAVPGARPADVTVGAAEWAGQYCGGAGAGAGGAAKREGEEGVEQERPVLLVSEYVAVPAEVGGRPGSGAAAYGTAAAAATPGAAASVRRAGSGQSKAYLADFGAATNVAADAALLAAVERGDVDALFSRTLVATRDYGAALAAVRERYGLRVARKSAAPLVDSADAAAGSGGDAPGAGGAASAHFDARQEGLAAVNDCWVARSGEGGYGLGGAPPAGVSLVQLGTCLSQACAAL